MPRVVRRKGTFTDGCIAPRQNNIAPLSTHSRPARGPQLSNRAAASVGALENLSNALLVEIPDEKAGELARAPGVQSVYPVRRFKMSLDHALPLHHVPDVWTQIGLANAGTGVMIGMIDSGIEIGHPGFNDAGIYRAARIPELPARWAISRSPIKR